MFAGKQRGFDVGEVEMIWRCNVDHGDGGVSKQLIQRAKPLWYPKLGSLLLCLLRRLFCQGLHRDAVSSQTFHVRRADEARAGHADPDCLLRACFNHAMPLHFVIRRSSV